jgi:hypothetical protein
MTVRWPRVVLYGVLPGLALLLAVAAGYLKFVGTTDDATADRSGRRPSKPPRTRPLRCCPTGPTPSISSWPPPWTT